MQELKKQTKSSEDGAQIIPYMAKHDVVPPQLNSDHCTIPMKQYSLSTTTTNNNANEVHEQSIEAGSIYELDHSSLPSTTPHQLKYIRVVMVMEKTEWSVSVRFPSSQSLHLYFTNSVKEMYPELDQKFIMDTKLAGKVLLRQVPTQEFNEKKHSKEFWSVKSSSQIGGSGSGDDDVLNKDICLSEIKSNGMVRWGVRRQVKFLGKHTENSNNPDCQSNWSSSVKGEERENTEQEKVDEDQNENEDEVEEREGEDELGDGVTEEGIENDEKKLKRKRYSFRTGSSSVHKAKKVKKEKLKQISYNKPNIKSKCKEMVLRNPKHRWSAARYKLAEENLLEVMKEKGATISSPLLRPELRGEARKRIGDTGLLDHLLKQMAGKVAPGGKERFRRRHNANGAMEYWLESADLVDIRKEAGVQDPFWVPPSGWKPGDCPTQDPICANEFKLLKEKNFTIKRDAEEMVSKKQLEEEVSKLKREMEDWFAKKKNEESQATLISNPGGLSQKFDKLHTSLISASMCDNDDAVLDSLAKYKEQLMVISDFLRRMQEEIGKLTSTRSNPSLMLPPSTSDPYPEKEKTTLDHDSNQAISSVQVLHEEVAAAAAAASGDKTTITAAEEKAAKIQRLKSGFRICKPQGTFLWPNKNIILSPQTIVQVEDLFMVPTPPSVSSSTASPPSQLTSHHHHHHHHYPVSPVKPLAEKRALTVTVSEVHDIV